MKKKGFFALYRYVFSYLTVALVPILIVMLLSYNFFIKEYQNEVEQNRASSLVIARNSFELMLSQMENLVKQIQMEDDLYYNMQEEFDTAIKLRNRLNKYASSSGYLKDILFYLHDSDTICAASSTYSVDSYAQTVNSMDGIDPPLFKKHLNEVESRTVLASRKETMMGFAPTEVTTFIYPLPYMEASPYATVMFKVDTSVIRKVFSGDQRDNYALIFHGNGEEVILAGDEQTEASILQILNERELDEKQGSFVKNLDGSEQMVSYLKSDVGDVTYLYLMPTQIAMAQVENVRLLFIMIMFSLIVVELVVLFFVAYHNYRPIKSLGKFLIHNFSETGTLAKEGFEIETAEQLLATLAVTHKQLNEQLAVSQDSLREVVLYKMINGGFSDMVELQNAQSESGIVITKRYLRIAILQMFDPQSEVLISDSSLLELMRTCLPDRQIYQCRYAEKLVYIIADNKMGQKEYREAMETLCANIKELNAGGQFCIGISDICSDISTLHLSYIQANSALEYRFVSGYNNAFFFTEVISDQDIYRYYPQIEIDEVGNAILSDDGDRFQMLIDQIIRQMKEHSTNLILAKLISYDVVHIILKVTLESGKGFTHINGKAPNIICLSATHSVDELVDLVQRVSEETVKYLGQKEQSSNSLVERAIEVINNNVYDYNFSVKQLADQFGISQNNLSQQFKRYTNQTPSEYMNRLRLEKAKYYLANYDMPIRLIVEKLGYSNESSFIRKFKDALGITPGEYRKRMNHRSGGENESPPVK